MGDFVVATRRSSYFAVCFCVALSAGCSDDTAGGTADRRYGDGDRVIDTIGHGATCSAVTDCGGETPLCAPSGMCAECVGGNDCPGNNPVCSNGWCGECAGTSDCASGFCVDGNCRDCASAANCPVDHACLAGRCEPPCDSDLDCNGGDEFCSAAGACIECSSSADCATRQPGNPICDTGTSRCRECMSGSDCDPTEVCADGNCEDCIQNTDCGADMVCDENLDCVANCVTTTPAVVCDPSFCDASRLTCVECTQSSQCTFSCMNGACTECNADLDCAGTSLDLKCIGGRCEQCRESADCVAVDAGNPYCVASSCEECLSTADCDTVAGEVCVDGSCEECVDDTPCTDPQQPACVNFQCEECRDDSHCASHPKGPACVNAQCEECETDAHCSAGTCIDLECR